MKNLLRHIIIGLGVAGFILAALTVLLFNRTTLGWQALSVPTGSMRPMMPPGSLAISHQVPLSSLRVGDVITHTNPLTMRTTLTHRIVKEYKVEGKIPVFVTKGDANPSPDPPIVGGLVKGKLAWHVPVVGGLLMWAKTWAGITVLVYLPALLIMIHETRLLAAYLRTKRPYHLEGWTPKGQVGGSRPKPVIAAGTLLALLVAGIGWQTAGALSAQSTNAVLLVLSSNVLTAQAAPNTDTKSMLPNSSTSCTNATNTSNTNTSSSPSAAQTTPAPTPGSPTTTTTSTSETLDNTTVTNGATPSTATSSTNVNSQVNTLPDCSPTHPADNKSL